MHRVLIASHVYVEPTARGKLRALAGRGLELTVAVPQRWRDPTLDRIRETSWERTQALLRSGALDVSPIITHRFDLADWERWSDANTETALPTPPGGPRPPETYSQVAWYMLEHPEWSYIPDRPRVRREDAGFIHWDVYHGRQAMTRWGIPATDAQGLGYLPNPQHFPQLIELHRTRLPGEGFAVYTTYATGHPRGGAALIIETWAESERDYYSRLVANQMALGLEGHRLLVGLLGNSSGTEDYDLQVIPELSHRIR